MQDKEINQEQVDRVLADLGFETIDGLQKYLTNRAKQEAEADRQARMKATPVITRYTILPSTDRHHEVYDNSCRLYRINGEVINAKEAKAAGHPDYAISSGGMDYIFNTLSGKLVCGVGGGTIWIGTSFTGEYKAAAHEAMETINWFLASHPEGGDITDIVLKFKEDKKHGHV